MQGYLLKGARALIWGRPDDGHSYFEQAARVGAHVDDYFLTLLTHKLLDYEAEFGHRGCKWCFTSFRSLLKQLGGQASVRQLKGSYLINRAFKRYPRRRPRQSSNVDIARNCQ